LILSTRGARVTGTVRKAGEGGARPKVVLIPDTGNTVQREYGTRVAVFDQYDTFALDSIAPGAYHLYAFENVPEASRGMRTCCAKSPTRVWRFISKKAMPNVSKSR